MRKRLIVGNIKMHLSVGQSLQLLRRLEERVQKTKNTEVVICPSYIALHPMSLEVSDKFKLGAQNLHFLDEGALTGEVSGTQLQGLVDYVIVGHSERRRKFNERNDEIARKMAAAIRNGLTPILCVGENLFERQDQHTDIVIHDQLVAALTMLTSVEVAKIVVAYEPVWAVDSQDIAKPDQIARAIKVIRSTIKELYGNKAAEQVRVLYGGHAEPENTTDYFSNKDLDGLLLGRASLNYEQFATVIKNAQS